jgi:hypothetical protein
MKRLRIVLALAVIVLTALGCSLVGGTGSEVENQPFIDTEDFENQPEGEPVTDSELFLPLDADMEIALLTPENGNGSHPLFEWEAAEGADLYMLFLFDQDHGAYWAWEGNNTQIYLGGFDSEPPENVDGPILLEPMTWVVIAATEDGEFVGSSQEMLVAP